MMGAAEGGGGGQKQKKIFPLKIIFKHIFLRILAKTIFAQGGKKDFPLTCTKVNLVSLKIPSPSPLPHDLSNVPSPSSYNSMQLYKGYYYFSVYELTGCWWGVRVKNKSISLLWELNPIFMLMVQAKNKGIDSRRRVSSHHQGTSPTFFEQ